MRTNLSTKKLLYMAVIVFLLFVSNSLVFAQQLSIKQLTFSDSTHDGYPYWSPDGKYIIYSSGAGQWCTTMKVPAEGGEPVQLTKYFSQHTQYSPDGSYIAFDGEVGTRVFVASADGGTPIRVVPESVKVNMSGLPCWSPDGQKIAFMSVCDLWTVDLTTGELSKIFGLEGKKAIPCCWSYDGQYILSEMMDTVSREFDIWKIPVDGSEAEQLTHFEGRQRKPNLSPDGSLIVFTSNHGGDPDLWVMPAEGGEPVQITFYPASDNNPGFDIEPSWSPDGKKIAFSSSRAGYWAVWVMEPDLEYIREKLKK